MAEPSVLAADPAARRPSRRFTSGLVGVLLTAAAAVFPIALLLIAGWDVSSDSDDANYVGSLALLAALVFTCELVVAPAAGIAALVLGIVATASGDGWGRRLGILTLVGLGVLLVLVTLQVLVWSGALLVTPTP